MPLVAGIDSSTQSCKVVVCDAGTGQFVRSGRAPHPAGTEVDPAAWERALDAAILAAGGLDDVAAVAVAGQQHGMVTLDDAGGVVRPALLWNDTRSAGAAADLVQELGGGQAWADAVGVVPVASFTITKLRWLAEHEPNQARRVAAVCLPHDWLSWRLSGSTSVEDLVTDRSDASGTAYWSSTDGYRRDLLELSLGHVPVLPRVAGPAELVGKVSAGAILAPGAGDNAAAALGLGAEPGDVVVSLGTSGVASAVSDRPARDGSGLVAGFADATGRFLPLACTLNAAQVLDGMAIMLGVDHDRLSNLALSGPPGSGLVLVPYLQGERTPDRPFATGSLHGLTLGTMSPAHLARAAVEGMLCGVADALDAVVAQGVPVRRVLLVGGAARSSAVRAIAPAVFGCPVVVPAPADHVAEGAARQAAWVLSGTAHAPQWSSQPHQVFEADPDPFLRTRYAEARDHVLDRAACDDRSAGSNEVGGLTWPAS
jgi:xylulokinase